MKKYLILLILPSLLLSCSIHRKNETRVVDSSAFLIDSILISRLQTLLLQKTLRERDRDSIGCLERVSVCDSVVTVLDASGKVIGQKHFRRQTKKTDISRQSAKSSDREKETVSRDSTETGRRKVSGTFSSEKNLKEEKSPPQTSGWKCGAAMASIMLFAVATVVIWVRRKSRKMKSPLF